MTEQKETAYHEAGHTVISNLYFTGFDYVTIIPDKKNMGHLRRNNFLPQAYIKNQRYYVTKRIFAETEAQIQWAGVLSYLLADLIDKDSYYYLDECCIEEVATLQDILEIGSEGDIQQLKDSIIDIAFPRAPKDLLLLWSLENAYFTIKTLIKYWGRVETIAGALLERETLSEKEVYEVLENEGQPFPVEAKKEALRIINRWRSPRTNWGTLRKKYSIEIYRERTGRIAKPPV